MFTFFTHEKANKRAVCGKMPYITLLGCVEFIEFCYLTNHMRQENPDAHENGDFLASLQPMPKALRLLCAQP